MSFEWFISRRYLRAKQKQSFISLITLLSTAGVMVGVMTLIVVIAVMAGAESDLKSRIAGIDSHVIVMRHGAPISDYGPLVTRIRSVDGITSAAPFVYAQVMLRSAAGSAGIILRGIDPDASGMAITDNRNHSLRSRLTPTEPLSGARPPGIILGQALAENVSVSEGDRVYLISSGGINSAAGHVPDMQPFTVVGIFESGMFEYDKSLAYVHLQDAQDLLRLGTAVTGIEAGVADIFKAGDIADRIKNMLGFPYWARDWMQMNQNLFISLRLQKVVMFIILTLIVLVAAFNITSTLIMMVMEKIRDISILKAMGATSQSIKKIFILKGMTIGLTGTGLGMGLGFAVCGLLKRYKFIELPNDVYYFSTLPVQLEALDSLVIAAATLLICFLATLYPARYASRLNPVDGIRYG